MHFSLAQFTVATVGLGLGVPDVPEELGVLDELGVPAGEDADDEADDVTAGAGAVEAPPDEEGI